MAANSYAKQNILENIAWDAEDDSTTLALGLKAYSRAQFITGKGGLYIQTTSANGKSVSRALPPGVSASEASEIISELRRLYEQVTAAFTSASITPTDAQILAEMLERLAPIKHAVADFGSIADWVNEGTEVVAL